MVGLEGKKVLIIGGSAGIGRATAQAALQAGAEVVIMSREQEHLDRAQEALGHVQTCVLDIRDVRGMDSCFEEQAPFHHLVTTATEAQAVPFLEVDLHDARQMFETKFWGQFAAAQEAAAYLDEGGSITLFSGVAAHRPAKGMAVIAAVNGAVEALVRSAALELSPLRVNAVCPGFVDTHGMDAERRQRLAERLPVQRIGEPAHVAASVLYLMQNPYTTGTVLYVDGGHRLV